MLTKILIADASVEVRFFLEMALKGSYCVLSCDNGVRALELLRQERPDLMVLDLMLPGMDGLALLAAARSEKICQPTLVTSVFLHDHIVNALEKENVVYLVRKPCDMDALVLHIQEIAMELSPPLFLRPDSVDLVTAVLFELGIPAGRMGFSDCRQAILMLRDNPGASFSKEVYPALDDNIKAVEKRIRDVIFRAYDRRDGKVWAKYFPVAPNGAIPKPTNRQFLSTLAQTIFSLNRRQA